jgi:hypothetical protein
MRIIKLLHCFFSGHLDLVEIENFDNPSRIVCPRCETIFAWKYGKIKWKR